MSGAVLRHRSAWERDSNARAQQKLLLGSGNGTSTGNGAAGAGFVGSSVGQSGISHLNWCVRGKPERGSGLDLAVL